MRNSATTLFILFSLLALTSFAQKEEGYYLFPINPGQQNFLAGSMGELRSSHFHAGLDIKTGGVSGLKVHAAADGYISRIKVSTGGYGHALYMSHPNGTTTVYAHLSKFSPEIDRYVLNRQYQEETFEIQLFPERNQFQFKKGEVIAFSGNTGSSSGPHLHFEIRDAQQRILDPLEFQFDEIKDNITPQMQHIAFVTLDGSARVNGTFGRYEFDVIKTKNSYKTRVPISLKGQIGIEVYAYDLLNGVYNRNGIAHTTLVIDDDTVFSETKNRLSFNKQRNILVHMDYARYRSGGRKFNKLWVDDGNTHNIYDIPGKGFSFTDTTHQVKIYLRDTYGNISTFETTVNNRKVVNPPDPEMDLYEIYRNHLHIKAAHTGTPSLVSMYFNGKPTSITPYREDRKVAYYLWNLRKGLPDSIDVNGKMHQTNIYSMIPSEREISFYNHDFDFLVNKYSLFDTLYLQFEKSYDSTNNLEVFKFQNWKTPLRSAVDIRLKPAKTYPEKTARVYGTYGGKIGSYQGGEWENGAISFSTRDLAGFTIAEDTIAPVITPRIIKSNQLYFKINDDRSGIKAYKATLDGQFLLMHYEPKQDLIWAVRKDENIPIKGEFILEVEDNTGNKSVFKRNLQ
jgi:murein DD-endopeptidase MepM/ murein hydrolase activator NlpD